MSEREISEAVAFREQYGLRAEPIYVRAVAVDPAAQAGLLEFGVPLLPSELADLLSRRWDPDLHRQVTAYGLLFPDDFAGAYINQKASGVVIAFKNDVDRHRIALSNLVAAGSVLEVRQVEWSLSDLEGFVDRIEAEKGWFDSIGVIARASANALWNGVHVRFNGPEDGAGLIEAHFGNPDWLEAARSGPLPWEGPRADLTVEVLDTAGKPVPQLRCESTPVDPSVADSAEGVIGTNGAGICVLAYLPVGLYVIELFEYVDNDHYAVNPIKSFRVELKEGGTSTKVVVPTP